MATEPVAYMTSSLPPTQTGAGAGFVVTRADRCQIQLTELPKVPPPRKVPLPLGGLALMYSREQLVIIYRCSHGELGRMLRAKMVPLPIRIDGQILWYVDEVLATQATTERTLSRWRKR
jgi:hypothetical protein